MEGISSFSSKKKMAKQKEDKLVIEEKKWILKKPKMTSQEHNERLPILVFFIFHGI